MQRANGARRSARKRRSDGLSDVDDDLYDPLYPKRSKRLSTSFPSRDQCQSLLTLLMKHKHGWPFNKPVDPVALNIPDYFDKITSPMDFGTIQKKLHGGEYETAEEWAGDVRLVFTNCWNYNIPNSDVYVMATVLSGVFEKNFKSIQAKETNVLESDEISEMQNVINELRSEHQKLLNELQKLVKNGQQQQQTQTTQGERSNSTKTRAAPSKKKPPVRKPKVKVQIEIFSVFQKKILRDKISNLTPEDLQRMVNLVAAEIPEEQKLGGELEIDLEQLTVPTLKKLDIFVDSCIKSYPPGSVKLEPIEDDDSSSSSDSDSSSSDSSDSESEPEKLEQPAVANM